MKNKELIKYSKRGVKKVNGWLYSGAIRIIKSLDSIQKNLDITGNIGEIGVHHGKLFILLYLLRNNNEKAIAIDVFENQVLNVDKSGRGDKEIFLANIKKHAKKIHNLHIIEKSSDEITDRDILELSMGKFRLFSIDGGHTAELTLNDLIISKDIICNGGIVILDDYFNENWPGVSVGTNQFIHNNNELMPFAIGGNKIFFTNDKSYAELYKEQLHKDFSNFKINHNKMWSSEVIIIDFKELTMKERLERLLKWNKIRENKLGHIIKSLYRKFLIYR